MDDGKREDEATNVLARVLEGRLREAFTKFCADIPQILRSLPRAGDQPDAGDDGADFVRALLEWIGAGSPRSERASRYLLMWYAKSVLDKGTHEAPDRHAIAELIRARLTRAELVDVDRALAAGWDALRYGGSLKTLASRQRKRFVASLAPEQHARFARYLALLPPVALAAGLTGSADAATRTATSAAPTEVMTTGSWLASATVVVLLPLLAGLGWYSVRGGARPAPDVIGRTAPSHADRGDVDPRPAVRTAATVIATERPREYVPTSGPGSERAKFGNRPPRLRWTRQVSGVSPTLNQIAWSGSMAVVVADEGTCLSSADGVDWRTTTLASKYSIFDVAFSSERKTWVAVGTKRPGTFAGRLTMVSNDGVRWDSSSAPDLYPFNAVAAGAGIYVAIGPTSVATSRDGRDWSVTANGVGEYLGGVKYVDGRFLVIGSDDTLLTSTDGWSWSVARDKAPRALFDAISGNGIDVAVGQALPAAASAYGVVRLSTDHVTWTELRLPDVDTVEAVAFDGHQFVVVGDGVFSSVDGQEWTLELPPDELYATDVVWTGSMFIAIGHHGTIYTSAPAARP